MPSYLSPGVYMEEVDKGSKPIEAVGTAVAAFIGYTEKASLTRDGESESLIGKPTPLLQIGANTFNDSVGLLKVPICQIPFMVTSQMVVVSATLSVSKPLV